MITFLIFEKKIHILIYLRCVFIIRNWSGPEIDGRCESVSINHVDNDGNTALHYAALNNLTGCILKLLSCGAIISIVNKDQKNCCELADTKLHKQLSDALELAILYQKEDSSMEIFNAGLQYSHEHHPAVYIVDAKYYYYYYYYYYLFCFHFLLK